MREIIEKIIDGCSEVKKNPDIHKDAKSLATLVIKDCNDALKKEWVGLTDEEIREFEIWLDNDEEKHGWNPPKNIVEYLEAKLKEKNNG